MNGNVEGIACTLLLAKPRYVNMAVPSSLTEKSIAAETSAEFLGEGEVRRGVELLYFGYTRLTRSIDEGLAQHGLGRAHHRVLYFIARQPDLSVSELLAFLAITKQSLGRVINDLNSRKLVESRPGDKDRRKKCLRLTAAGEAFEAQLFDALRSKLAAAYAAAGEESVAGFWRILEGLIPEDEIAMVLNLQAETK
jgi:DNA-binding MarR family transcriptional regulator